jgi:ketosteroid isomerase-like protein
MDANAKLLVKLDDDWSAATAARDADRMASCYAEDAIAYPPNEPVAVGRAAAKKVWAAYFADQTCAISWKAVHAEMAKGGDLGVTAGTFADSSKGPDGKLVGGKGKLLCTWKKQKDGSWKAFHGMWNYDSREACHDCRRCRPIADDRCAAACKRRRLCELRVLPTARPAVSPAVDRAPDHYTCSTRRRQGLSPPAASSCATVSQTAGRRAAGAGKSES